MAKVPTAWASRDGTSILSASGGGALLLEQTGYLLLEQGGHLLFEDVIAVPKHPTTWDKPLAKSLSSWASRDGLSRLAPSNAGVFRGQQNGVDTRVMQNGTDTRILNDTVSTPKAPTKWDIL